MNKFLNIWFLIGKWILSIGLILVALCALYTGFNAAYMTVTYKDNPISYSHSTYSAMNYVTQGTQTKDNNSDLKDKITSIVKEAGMPQNCTPAILDKMYNIAPEDQKDFIDNMAEFYKSAINAGIKNIKAAYPQASTAEIKKELNYFDVYKREIVPVYFDYYTEQKEAQKAARNLNTIKRNINLYVLGSCIILFILMLIVPILIRIEENTRK